MHHLAVQPDGGLHHTADADVLAPADEALHFHGNQTAQGEGGSVRVSVPAAGGRHDIAPRSVARFSDEPAPGWVKVDVELVGENSVRGQDPGPHGVAGGGADVLFAEHVEGLESETFADVGFRGQPVWSAELVGELHVAEGLRKISDAFVHSGLQVVEHAERMLFYVFKNEAALRGAKVDDVFLGGAGFGFFEGVDDPLGELADGVVLGGIV